MDPTETPGSRRTRRALRLVRTLVAALVTYLLVVLAARLGHRRLLYQPPDPRADDEAAVEGAERLVLHATDGAAVHVLAFGIGEPTVVHFHGNAETAAQNVGLARALQQRGLTVWLVEYRGYGPSRERSPDEQGLYADAEAALSELSSRGVAARSTVLWGQSLGGGVALEMARRGRGARLVLVAPFTSTAGVARGAVPLLPADWVMVDRFDNLAKAPTVDVETRIVHGDADVVVPLEHGRQLAAALPRVALHEIPGGEHGNLYRRPGVLDELAAFARGGATPTSEAPTASKRRDHRGKSD